MNTITEIHPSEVDAKFHDELAEDGLEPSRGILAGLLLSALLWTALAGFLMA